MPGRLDANLRSAFLAEDFGALLLRGLGAVAEVARVEDFGIDAFWTLLEPVGARRLNALDTSFVQLKAESVTKIAAEDLGDGLWLRALRLPLYYGVVTRPGKGEPRLDLYTSHLLHDELTLRKDLRNLGVCFNSKDATYPTMRWHQDMNNAGSDGPNPDSWFPADHLNALETKADIFELQATAGIGLIWLGPPILTMTLSTFEAPAERERCFLIINRWNELELQNRSLSHMRHVNRARWRTNSAPYTEWKVSQPVSRNDYLKSLSPSVNAMLLEHAVLNIPEADFEEAVRIYEYVAKLGGDSMDLEMIRQVRANSKLGPQS